MISTPLDYEIFTPCFISLDMFQVYKQDMSPSLQSMGTWIEFVSYCCVKIMGIPGGSDSKEYAYNSGDLGLIPWLGKTV